MEPVKKRKFTALIARKSTKEALRNVLTERGDIMVAPHPPRHPVVVTTDQLPTKGRPQNTSPLKARMVSLRTPTILTSY
jgi:hypothetical protein